MRFRTAHPRQRAPRPAAAQQPTGPDEPPDRPRPSRYGAAAPPDSERARWLRRLLPLSGQQAIEVGCAGGRHTHLLAERYAHVEAVDHRPAMLDTARLRHPLPTIRYREAALLDTGPAGGFDLVFSADVRGALALPEPPADPERPLDPEARTASGPPSAVLPRPRSGADPADHRAVGDLVEELEQALTHLRSLAAPGGRVLLVDVADPVAGPLLLPHARGAETAAGRLRPGARNRLDRTSRHLLRGARVIPGPSASAVIWDRPLR